MRREIGEVEFETSDGDIRRLPAGSVVLAENTTGKGDITLPPPDRSSAVSGGQAYAVRRAARQTN